MMITSCLSEEARCIMERRFFALLLWTQTPGPRFAPTKPVAPSQRFQWYNITTRTLQEAVWLQRTTRSAHGMRCMHCKTPYVLMSAARLRPLSRVLPNI